MLLLLVVTLRVLLLLQSVLRLLRGRGGARNRLNRLRML